MIDYDPAGLLLNPQFAALGAEDVDGLNPPRICGGGPESVWPVAALTSRKVFHIVCNPMSAPKKKDAAPMTGSTSFNIIPN